MKALEEYGKQILRTGLSKEGRFKELAIKHGMKVTETGVDLGCPWVVNPLGQTEEVKFAWSLPFWGAKTDKYERFEQGLNALEAIDLLVNGGIEQGFSNHIDKSINAYIQLSVYGRIMFFNIAKNQDSALAESIIKTISPFASEGLNMNSTDFIKAEGVTAGKMFDKFIKPELDVYSNEVIDEAINSSNNNNNNDVAATEEKEIKTDKRVVTNFEKEMLEKAIQDLSNFYKITKQGELEISDFMNPNGCNINTPFKQALVNLYNSDAADQSNFNSEIAGLVIEYFPNY